MNLSITIGDETRTYASASPKWINKAFSDAHRTGVLPGVIVQINMPGMFLGLATPGSGRGGGGGVLTQAQERIVEMWMRHHMMSSHYTGGNLIAFLGELEKALS